MRYELTDLKLFIAIAESDSLSAGASAIHLSAPSASYRLKNLELAIGAPLFTRGPRGMTLTAAGRVLLEHVRSIMSIVQHMHSDIARFGSGERGQIRVMANSSCMEGLMSRLGRYLVTHPNVNVELEERLSADIVQAIANHNADIGLLAGDVETGQLSSSLYAHDELIVVTAIQHSVSSQTPVSFATLLDEDFVMPSKRSSNYIFLSKMASVLGRQLNVRVNVQSFPVVLRLVEANVGISVIPRSVAMRAIRAGRVTGIPLAEDWARRKQRIVAIDFDDLPAFVREFVAYLQFPEP
ncbi:LysR family transcriptional regulator [Salmonella enterica subsp. enterica]|nr:LysR family transcriptional regulator [Salmonella enterica subsp. enterica]